MKKIFTQIAVFIIVATFQSREIFAQSYFQEILKSSPYNQEGQDVLPVSDGGYLVAGYTTNSTLYDHDVLLIKTNSVGKEQWRKTFGGNKPDFPYHMLATSDGNFFLIGYSQSFRNGDYDIYLLKVDPSGTLLWSKTYGGYGNDIGYDIIRLQDGNYLITGSSNSHNFTDNDAMLIKIDPAGTIIWSKHYGGPSDENGKCVKQAPDGNLVMLGQTYRNNPQYGDAWLVKLNSNGDTTWTKTYGGSYNDEGVYVTIASDGGYVMAIRDSSNAGKDVDIRIIKTNTSGIVTWNKVFGGDKKDTPKMIQRTMDGGFLVAGHSRSFGWVNPDMWILKCNSSGDTIWSKHYGGYDHEHCYVARELTNGSIIAVGKTASFSSDWDPIFLKISSTGTMTVNTDEEEQVLANIDLYPNPSENSFMLDFKKPDEYTVFVRDFQGKEVFSTSAKNVTSLKIEMDVCPAGIYYVTCFSAQLTETRKVVLTK